MAVVYLPMGYPLQQGLAFDNIVYQGTVARMYTVPKDPRTDAQMFSRKLTSDVSKMRATAGVYARQGWKCNYGTHWSNVIHELVKSDFDGLWTEAMDAFDEFTEDLKAEWNANAPYQVTYNEPGRMYWGLVYVIYHQQQHVSRLWFEMPEPLADDMSSMLTWWTGGYELLRLPVKSVYGVKVDDLDASLGSWTGWVHDYNSSYYNAHAYTTTVNGQTKSFIATCHRVSVIYALYASGGSLEVRVDGTLIGTINQYAPSTVYQAQWDSPEFSHGSHTIEVKAVVGVSQVVDVDAFILWNFYQESDVLVWNGTKTTYSDSLACATAGAYVASGEGNGFEFDVMGKYVVMGCTADTDRGGVNVYMDGVYLTHFSEWAGSKQNKYYNVVTMPDKKLHHLAFLSDDTGKVDLDFFAVRNDTTWLS